MSALSEKEMLLQIKEFHCSKHHAIYHHGTNKKYVVLNLTLFSPIKIFDQFSATII